MTSTDLAQRILDQITQHPDNFSMDSWFYRPGNNEELPSDAPVECGTTMCIAGWAAHLSGWTLVHHIEYEDIAAEQEGEGGEVIVIAEKEGEESRDIVLLAKELLGLAQDDLFYGSNEGALERLQALVDQTT